MFAFALPGAFINPAMALTQMVQGNVKPLRFVVLGAPPTARLPAHTPNPKQQPKSGPA